MKRPAFQFYPADWRKDTALQLCSIGARGLWWEMICLMHEAEPYGHLVAAGKAVDCCGLARLVGEPPKTVEKLLSELRSASVFTVTDAGIICSRRMVRDEKERHDWRDRQDRHREKARDKARDVTPPVTPKVTPPSRSNHADLLSSSSSSSSKQGQKLVLARPSPEHERLASELKIDCQAEFEKYLDHFAASGKPHKDQDAGFRNWLRRAAEFKQRAPPQTNGHASSRAKVAHAIFGEQTHGRAEEPNDISGQAERID